jgi:hypothetical protein
MADSDFRKLASFNLGGSDHEKGGGILGSACGVSQT